MQLTTNVTVVDFFPEAFIAEACEEKGMKRNDALHMWQNFEYFSGYGFNKSHAVCYSMISYQCAWLMTYHEGEWMAAFLDKVSDKKKEGGIATAKYY